MKTSTYSVKIADVAPITVRAADEMDALREAVRIAFGRDRAFNRDLQTGRGGTTYYGAVGTALNGGLSVDFRTSINVYDLGAAASADHEVEYSEDEIAAADALDAEWDAPYGAA